LRIANLKARSQKPEFRRQIQRNGGMMGHKQEYWNGGILGRLWLPAGSLQFKGKAGAEAEKMEDGTMERWVRTKPCTKVGSSFYDSNHNSNLPIFQYSIRSYWILNSVF
jgi:hypothetical protein